MADIPGPIVIFDGMCNLCSGAVVFALRQERNRELRFTTLQSKAGQAQLSRFGISAGDAATLYLIDRDGVHTRSDAVIRLSRYLRWPWRAAAVFRFFPRRLRNGVYDFIARRRYGWFGQRDRCFAPPGDSSSRFLNEEHGWKSN
jgi:predicted DCC family thiol-disulfide oxidoreductase YuxK